MTELSRMIEEPQHTYKIVLIGASKFGKTLLLNQFGKDIPHNRSETSLGTITLITYNHLDNVTIKIQIWDTDNVDNETKNQNLFYKDVMGSIVMYDTKCRDSFESAKSQCISLLNDKKVSVILVGNAYTSTSVVPALEAKKFASEHGIEFSEFDVEKELDMVHQCFQKLITDIYDPSIDTNLTIPLEDQTMVPVSYIELIKQTMEKEAKQNQDVMNDLLEQLKSKQTQIETLKAILANNDKTGVEKVVPLKSVLLRDTNEFIPILPLPAKPFHIEDSFPKISQKPKKEEPIKFFKL
ncbi:P-loop containing nucleoside triphosphate hydrolase protein [Thamnidium elegans]|uniref:Uncharacterized protein n=1 Tax=Thamnidium elegans TaxID=101142 RepID=A0A8H7SVI0_9FUNG|nr:hypothetical protein INT48_001393 [Thamnidium elegans]KAI8070099.1 P-loop containing nucleoside triphosphate hydrolase protein [Thamnidium elegans]